MWAVVSPLATLLAAGYSRPSLRGCVVVAADAHGLPPTLTPVMVRAPVPSMDLKGPGSPCDGRSASLLPGGSPSGPVMPRLCGCLGWFCPLLTQPCARLPCPVVVSPFPCSRHAKCNVTLPLLHPARSIIAVSSWHCVPWWKSRMFDWSVAIAMMLVCDITLFLSCLTVSVCFRRTVFHSPRSVCMCMVMLVLFSATSSL